MADERYVDPEALAGMAQVGSKMADQMQQTPTYIMSKDWPQPERFPQFLDKVGALLAEGLDADGVVASSDVMAMSAIAALADAGRRVPEDVAVTGFDDVPSAAYTTPSLTTVRQDVARGAEQLVDLLMRQLAGEAVASIRLPTELMVRRSAP